jgi:hypothetical protein
MPANARALPEHEAVSGPISPEPFATYDPATSSWRTSQRCLGGEWDEFSATFPRSGTMRNGRCYLRPMSALLTSAPASGLWPIPRTTGLDGGSNSRNAAKARGYWPTPDVGVFNLTESFESWVARSARMGARHQHAPFRPPLALAVRIWSTPRASDGEKGGPNQSFGAGGTPLPAQVGGTLNPRWVEWLQGYPIGWTDLT